MKNTWKNYLVFTKKEGRGLMVLFAVLVGLLILPEHLVKPVKVYKVDSVYKGDRVREIKKFRFNPNQITKQQWIALGVPEKTANTILNYRNKGGSFRTSNDLYKIWGMPPQLATDLIPWVDLPPQHDVKKPYIFSPTPSAFPKYQRPIISVIDINTATETEWEALPGIGPVLAKRILRFRDKLGSFKQVEEIQKTYGLSDTVFKKIQPYLSISAGVQAAPTSAPELLSLNKATEKEMTAAGIAPFVAKAILIYRKEKGGFSKLEELKNIVFINDSTYKILAEKFRRD